MPQEPVRCPRATHYSSPPVRLTWLPLRGRAQVRGRNWDREPHSAREDQAAPRPAGQEVLGVQIAAPPRPAPRATWGSGA